MTTVRERRFQLMLYTTDEQFVEPERFICELQSCQLTFQLATIPKAVVKPLFGTVINNDYAEDTSFDDLFDLASRRAPVQIILKVTQSFKSFGEKEDSDEWEFEPAGGPDEFGQYSTKPIVIFEGYLTPPTAEVLSTRASMTLTIVHWLSSLANISMLTTACHTSMPMELALRCYTTLAVGIGSEKAKWTPINKNIDLVTSPGGLWKEGIKKLFTAVLDYEGTDKYNDFIDNKRERIRLALDRIEGSALELRTGKSGIAGSSDEPDSIGQLALLISLFLNTDIYQTYIKQSAWDRLLYYSNAFLFSIVPRVSDAKLIPLPSVINPNKVHELRDDDIFQISSSPLSTVQLSRLLCVPSTTENVSAGDQGKAAYPNITCYPTEIEAKGIDGYVKAIAYPEWIVRTFPHWVPTIDQPIVTATATDLQEIANNAEKKKEAIRKARESVLETLGRGYTKASFIMQSLNTTWANVVIPMRMDICPGSAVRCFLHVMDQDKNLNSDTKLEIYGIVTGTVISIASGKTPATTQLTLSMIRDGYASNKKKSYSSIYDDITNPYAENPNTVGFYQKFWDGTEVKLYD